MHTTLFTVYVSRVKELLLQALPEKQILRKEAKEIVRWSQLFKETMGTVRETVVDGGDESENHWQMLIVRVRC